MRNIAEIRRKNAVEEIGKTEVKSKVCWALILVFCITILSVPTIQHIVDIRGNLKNGENILPKSYQIFDLLPNWHEVVEVRNFDDFLNLLPSLQEINEYEDMLEEESAVSNWILPHTQYFLTTVLKVGNEQAYLGRKKWLFYRPDIDAVAGYGFLTTKHVESRKFGGKLWKEPPQPDPVKAILHFNQQLEKRGITLIVMPIPLKPTIHPEKFSRRYQKSTAPIHNPSYRDFVDKLRKEGILVFDISSILFDAARKENQYLQTDTHWRPEAMELIASHLAEFIKNHVSFANTDTVEYTRTPVKIKNLGDIATMLKLPENKSIFSQEQVNIKIVKDATGETWSPEQDSEILFLGDSFSNIYSLEGMGWGKWAGLVEQLSADIGKHIDKIVINAGGAYSTRQALYQELKRGEKRLAGKSVLIYQFANRELFSGDWKLYDLPYSEPEISTVAKEETSVPKGAILIEATIKDKAEPPMPGTVPYPECLIAIHLTDIKAQNDSFPTEEAVVFVWGMRSNKWTKAASLKAGQKISLSVQPWEQVEAKYGSYNRKELDSEESWFLDIYWGETEP